MDVRVTPIDPVLQSIKLHWWVFSSILYLEGTKQRGPGIENGSEWSNGTVHFVRTVPPWSQRLSFILILRREPLLLFFCWHEALRAAKESLWSRPLGTSLSCHQLLTVVSDWRIFLIALRVIWLDGLNIFGDGSGVSMLSFMGRCRELLLYQPIFSPGKGKIFVVVLAYKNCKFRRSW